MAGKTIKVAFLGDVSKLKAALDQSDRALEKNRTSLQKTADSFSKAGNAFSLAGGAILAPLAMFAKQADAAEIGTKKLENSIKNSTVVTMQDKKALDELAASLRDSTVASRGQVKQAEALLVQFGMTAEQVQIITPLVVDLSRKMGIDMDTAAKMVGKSVDGSAGALKRAGIVIDETALKADSFGATVKGLQGTVGGFAEEEGQTFSGQLEIMKHQLDGVTAGIGKGVLDAFKKLLGPVKALSDAFTSLPKPLQEGIGTFGAFAGGALLVAGALSKMISFGMNAAASFSTLGQRTKDWIKIDWSGRMSDMDKSTKSLTSLGGAMASVTALVGAGIAAWQIWSAAIQKATQQGLAVEEQLAEKIKKHALSYDQVVNGAKAAQHQYEEFKKAAGDVSWYEVWNLDAKKAADDNADTAERMALKMNVLQGLADGLAIKYGLTSDEAMKMAQANMSAGRTAGDATGLFVDEEEALDKLKSAFDDATKGVFGFYDAQFKTLDLNLQWRDSIRQAGEEIRKNGYYLIDHTAKGEANIKILEGLAKQALELGEHEVELGHGTDAARDAVNRQVEAIRAQAASWGFNKGQVDAFLASMGLLKPQVDMKFEAPGLAEEAYNAERLVAALQKVGGLVGTALTGMANVQNSLHLVNPNIPGRAIGGTVNAGATYLVGERGPELLTMGSRSGSVTPARETAEAMGGGDLHVTLTLDGRELARTLIPEFRRQEVARL